MKWILLLIILSFGCTDIYEYRIVRKKKNEKAPKEFKSLDPNQRSIETIVPETIPVAIPEKITTLQSLDEWNKLNEGFLNRSVFQVKVSSLKPDKEEALLEAEEVAKKKATKLLIAEGVPYMTPESKVEIKILVEENGKIISDSVRIDDKYFFVFQVKKPALEIIVKEKLK
jgi:16S rRNA C967 or C1407 C5-methylase (RsmB/RsmF family)